MPPMGMKDATAAKSMAIACTALAVAAATGMAWYYVRNRDAALVSSKSPSKPAQTTQNKATTSQPTSIAVRILYGTQTGTAKALAERVAMRLNNLQTPLLQFQTSVVNLRDYDQDNLEQEAVVLVVMSTWTHGAPPNDARVFCAWLHDMALDFRVPRSYLGNVRVAVLGLGNAEYDEHYGVAAVGVAEDLVELGASKLGEVELLEDNHGDLDERVDEWSRGIVVALGGENTKQQRRSVGEKQQPLDASSSTAPETKTWLTKKQHRRRNKAQVEQLDRENTEWNEEDAINESVLASTESNKDDGVVDVEDIGKVLEENAASAAEANGREMVTPMQRRALTKEGYKIIGTHSAVKLCRWTKHQLRGRGGCYKHTFYGITSYQCMETTPSLACANKCVFCWRHHKNPVGRTWRWKTDDPVVIVEGAIERHQNMIKELKGLPGLRPERWQEAFTVRHCALSLVGEPIMYPQINEFCRELHKRQISSFLVTNAQFPDKIAALEPVTQLYVSVDAATKDALQAVDRPLFQDFWDRFIDSLRELKRKGQRTVYRMTLVKSYNMEDLDAYAELIRIGEPDFIEVKAVTYCGKSDASNLTMKNVPWHTEVRTFCAALCSRVSESYGLATEHAHSTCVLLAKHKFCIEGQWHTWIDFDKFQTLVARYYEDGTEFTADDYAAPTPSWAVYDAPEQGFDPVETRFHRTKDGKAVEDSYQETESGCG